MKVKLSIREKLFVYLLIPIILIYIVIFGIFMIKIRTNSLDKSFEYVEISAENTANQLEGKVNKLFNIVRTLAQSFQIYENVEYQNRKLVYTSTMENVARENPDLLSLWVNWELAAWDTSWNLPYGRVRYAFFRDNDHLVYKEDELNTRRDDLESHYYMIKSTGKETITPPYLYSFSGLETENYLVTSLSVPVKKDNNFIGLVGTDILPSRITGEFLTIKKKDESFYLLVSHDGQIISSPDKEFLGSSIDGYPFFQEKDSNKLYVYSNDLTMDSIKYNIRAGEDFRFIKKDPSSGKKWLVIFTPIRLGNTSTPWNLVSVVPYKSIVKDSNRTLLLFLLIGIAGLILINFLVLRISSRITRPLYLIYNKINEISRGKIDPSHKLDIQTGDENEKIALDTNNLVEKLHEKTLFAGKIKDGNFNVDLELAGEEDELGKSLLDLKTGLLNSKEENQRRRKDDEQANWSNTGLAKFAEHLREHTSNLNEFCYNIISNLCKYIEAEIGGMYILNDNDEKDKFLELKASFAYDRRKYIENRVDINEGLVGSSFLEKGKTYLEDIPDEYMSIDSGLGETTPSVLLIVPLLFNDVALGIFEIASLKKFQSHEIAFIEKVAEITASTLQSVKTNVTTSELLERSRQQSEELQSQEEEMRQNMEELQATHEEISRREESQKQVIDRLNAENAQKIKEANFIQDENIKVLKEKEKESEQVKKLYEDEINAMYEIWYMHLKNMDKKLNL